MVKYTIIIGIYFFFSLGSIKLYSQSNITAGGGEATGNGGEVNYSVGQIDYITETGSNGTTTSGVQQPYEIYVQSGIMQTDINLSIFVYPNPSADFAILNIENQDIQKMSYKLFDTQGKLIIQKEIKTNPVNIELSDLNNGIYFIKVMKKNAIIKTFKIIKNK